MAASTKGVKVADARRKALDKSYLAKARKAGHVEFAAQLLGVDVPTLVSKGVTKSGVWHAADIGGAIERRALVARNVRAMSQPDFDGAMTDGSCAFLASIWQCKTTGTFANMRKSETYGRETSKTAKAQPTKPKATRPTTKPATKKPATRRSA